MRPGILVTILVAASAAEASTIEQIVGKARNGAVERAALTSVDGHIRLTVVVTTESSEMEEVTVPITLPRGLVATGLGLAQGTTRPAPANLFVRTDARESYDEIVTASRDPALLEASSNGRLLLHVFPVTDDTPATITIELSTSASAAHVDQRQSLLAVPRPRSQRLDLEELEATYAEYWPQHRD